jgi:hypothetical protein
MYRHASAHTMARPLVAAAVGLTMLLANGPVRSATPRFLADDPLAREPDSQDAAGAQPWEINLAYDLSHAYLVTAGRKPAGIRAGNVNTIDEVPDSSWFTNRIGARALPIDDLVTGPNANPAPDPATWTVIREKSSGFAAGFTARDARGATWFVSFDPPSNPEGATGAIVVATKLFWALGYNQVENHLAAVRRANVRIDPAATIRRPSGRRTPMTADDLEAVFSRAMPGADGAYRIAAGRLLPGRILGGFKYEGTRPDDPNDVVPHEHRRELRALRVFGAWTNLTDMKAGNTLDTVVPAGGRSVVRHYLQDVGSTFGVGAQGPHDWSEGWEYVLQGGPALRRLFSLGLAFSRWQTVHYEEIPAIGRFEGDAFDPGRWRPRAPVRAYNEMRDDDGFWAARRVMAFSDEAIRAVVGTARFTDPRAAELLATVLIKRRDRIGRHYLPRINPVVDPTLDPSGRLSFANAAVDHGAAPPPRQYLARWFAFDNATGAATPLGESQGPTTTVAAPTSLPSTAGAFVRIDISSTHPEHPSWSRPVETYFRREASGWTLVGLYRLPDQ